MRVFNPPSDVPVRDSQAGLHKNPLALRGAPILLTAELTGATALPAGAQNVPFPTVGLQPENRVGYWIDEVRMSVGQLNSNDSLLTLPAAIGMTFQTGKYQLTRLPVPMMMFGPVVGYDEYLGGDAESLGGSVFGNFRWVFPKPLYMGPGDLLQARASRDATLGKDDEFINASVSYVGRTCAPGEDPPETQCVPWVSNYLHPYSSAYSQTFDEYKNPFLSDLYIQRLVNRFVFRNHGATDTEGLVTPSRGTQALQFVQAGKQMGQGALPSASGATYVQGRLHDSMGYEIVPNFSPMGTIVDPVRCAWTFSRAISAREKLQAAFQTVAPSATIGYDCHLSIVGYREER